MQDSHTLEQIRLKTPSPSFDIAKSFRTFFKEQIAKSQLIDKVADKFCNIAMKQTSNLTVRTANEFDELMKAYRLVYKEYQARGYCKENSSQIHYTHYCMLPDARTFVLEDEEKLLGTVSIVIDSPCGLPMEKLFSKEVRNLRKPGRRLAEVTLLSLDSDIFSRSRYSLTDFKKFTALFRLFKIMINYAVYAGVTDVLITVHPKHKKLYSYLQFNSIGTVQSYAQACGNPGLPMQLDLENAEQNLPRDYGVGMYFFKEKLPIETFKYSYKWNDQVVKNLLIDKSQIWTEIPRKSKLHLKHYYPSLVA
jgi:hypothetical protein